MILLTRRSLVAVNNQLKRELRLCNPFLTLKSQPKCNLHTNSQNAKITKNVSNYSDCFVSPISGSLRSLTFKTQTRLTCISLSLANTRDFHTTPKRYNPIVSIFLRNAAKIVSIYFARMIRKWWRSRTPEEKAIFKVYLAQHKWKILSPFIGAFIIMILYYFANIQETPITKRPRFIAFTKKQFEVISKLESEANIHLYQDKLLPSDHQLTQRVGAIVKQILQHNKDQPIISDNEWAVSVIKDDNNINAFVLPSGQIFVFSGLLKICDNDDQLGIVLSHEISHAVLLHGIEMMSHAHLVDLIFIGLIGVLWMFLPTDFLAAAMTAFSRLVLKIGLDAPYSRMLETEADEVGLQFAAKACFDVREASIFWEKMNIIEQEISGIPQLDIDVEFLMSHPTHEHRAENLNSMMEKVLELRKNCGCKPLPALNRTERMEAERKKISKMIKEKNYEGVLKIGDI